MVLISNITEISATGTNARDLGPSVNTATGYGSAYTASRSLGGNLFSAADLGTGVVYTGINGVLLGADTVLRYVYEPALDGGALSSINPLRGIPIPVGFVIEDASFWVDTALVGAGASIALSTATYTVDATTGAITVGTITAGNIYAATAITTSGTVGKKQGIPIFGTAATATRINSESLVVVQVTGAALTAGRLIVTLRGTKVS